MKDSWSFRLAYGIMATIVGVIAILLTIDAIALHFVGELEELPYLAILISTVLLASGLWFLVSTAGMIKQWRQTWYDDDTDDVETTLKTVKGIDIDKIPYKSKTTAILFCIFLGALGIHRIYIGHTPSGILMLIASLIGGWTVVIPVYMVLVAIIDLFFIAGNYITDGYNRSLV